jgi:polyhydroxybutyrate depolymerase
MGVRQGDRIEMSQRERDRLKVLHDVQQGQFTQAKAAEVVLVVIEEGGHTWPGQQSPVEFIGKSAINVSANDLMWEFFQ